MSLASDLLAAALQCGCGVRPLPADALPSGPCVVFANPSSHLDFATLWVALPPAQRRRVRPVAGRDSWGKGPLRRWLAGRVFRAVLIARQNVTVAPLLAIITKLTDLVGLEIGATRRHDGPWARANAPSPSASSPCSPASACRWCLGSPPPSASCCRCSS